MVVVSWTLNDDPENRDLSCWRCPHSDAGMTLCIRCYHPFDFIYVELKGHRPRCPRLYSCCHRRCVAYSSFSLLAPFFVVVADDPNRVGVGPDTLALIGQDEQDGPMAYWECMYGNWSLSRKACGRCYEGTHGMYWKEAKTYRFEHRHRSLRIP